MENLNNTIYLSPLCSPSELNSRFANISPVFSTPGRSEITLTDQKGFLLPPQSSSKTSNRTASKFSVLKSPNLYSSAEKNKGSSSPFLSPFLKRRDLKREDKTHNRVFLKKPRKIVCDSPVDLDKKLSVGMVLKDLKLEHLTEAFEKHEVDLDALFSMSDDILKFIGVGDGNERRQILTFTHDFKTPLKLKKIPPKPVLARNGFR